MAHPRVPPPASAPIAFRPPARAPASPPPEPADPPATRSLFMALLVCIYLPIAFLVTSMYADSAKAFVAAFAALFLFGLLYPMDRVTITQKMRD
ncbi:hypothetical protein TeGR_g5688 [Tetraparma gracilis]|uniref:Uncharacterized protein n=1 Tax=Tetraparma gracilis TaxID=2962635 RepID=A0ABQ6MZQ1_9STRA|nr:hypothetical protein TeGR_g5688 [Tetraparma gracilis]